LAFPDEDQVGFLMDYCDSKSLADLIAKHNRAIRKGKAEPTIPFFVAPSAAQLVRDACRGLAAAHRARLVHSDIKSGNILLQTRDTEPSGHSALIGDFGFAKFVQASGGSLSASSATRGNVGAGGTANWMSPEQLKSGKVVPASDMYSLGCVIWELATGRLPWTDEDTGASLRDVQIIAKVVSDGERLTFPSECESDPVWAELVEVAQMCFAENPEERPTAADVATRLNGLSP
jgi:serine/threonine protein kinase